MKLVPLILILILILLICCARNPKPAAEPMDSGVRRTPLPYKQPDTPSSPNDIGLHRSAFERSISHTVPVRWKRLSDTMGLERYATPVAGTIGSSVTTLGVGNSLVEIHFIGNKGLTKREDATVLAALKAFTSSVGAEQWLMMTIGAWPPGAAAEMRIEETHISARHVIVRWDYSMIEITVTGK